MKNIMVFSPDRNSNEAIEFLKDKKVATISIGSDEEHSLRFVQYHLHEYQIVVIDKAMKRFDDILSEVLERALGERLEIKVLIVSPEEDKEQLEKKIGSELVSVIKVNYTKKEWLYELI